MNDHIDHLGLHFIDQSFVCKIVEDKQGTETFVVTIDGEIIDAVIIYSNELFLYF